MSGAMTPVWVFDFAFVMYCLISILLVMDYE